MKKIITILLTVHCSLLTVHSSLAQIIHVPADQPTIQAGINAAANGDTVLVAPGWYYESINFNGKNIIVASHFLITSNPDDILQTKIIGDNSNSNVTISGGVDSTALLCGFQVRNGNSNNGAGICCQNSSPRLRDLQVMYNQSQSNGGGIYLDQASPLIQNVTVFHNKSDDGGGIFMTSCSNPHLINVTIDHNVADYGAGIYCSSSNPIFTSVSIKYNVAEEYGGGLVINSYTPWLIPLFDGDYSCSIYNNVADEAIDISTNISFDLVLDTFSVAIPTDYYASALYMISYDVLHGINYQVDADLYISPQGNDNNSGLTAGDPLKSLDYAFSIIVADSLHIHTIFLSDGDYSYLEYPINLPDYIHIEGMDETAVVLDARNSGGVIRVTDNSASKLIGITIKNGYARRGGGIFCSSSLLSIENITISGNTAPCHWLPDSGVSPGMGGGIFCRDSELTLVDVDLNYNDAAFGGAIYCENSHQEHHNVHIFENEAYEYIYIFPQGGMGAGICCSNSSLEINGSNIGYNEAAGSGGGIYADYGSRISIQNSNINDNIAGNGYLQSGSGAGISLYLSELYLTNVILSANQVLGIGGGICSRRSGATIYNVTLADNIADSGSAMCLVDSSNTKLVNAILYQNSADAVFFSSAYAQSNLSVQYSDIEGGEESIVTNNNALVLWGEGNIDEDPLFAGMAPDPFQLMEGSPCIETGTPDTSGLYLPLSDIIGNMRFWDADGDGDTIVDMGAYEFGSIPVGVIEPTGQKSGVKSQNYPNPFSISTTFTFQLEQYSVVNVKIFNSTGQKIDEIRLSSQSPGKHEIIWNAEGTPAGIYYYRLQAGKFTEAGKMILIK